MDSEEVWRSKQDSDVLAAADRLADYTEEGDRLIRAELKRRGLPEPPPTGGQVPPLRAIDSGQSPWQHVSAVWRITDE